MRSDSQAQIFVQKGTAIAAVSELILRHIPSELSAAAILPAIAFFMLTLSIEKRE